MNSIRKWLYRPKKSDNTLLAQFFFADEDLNVIAAELDSFDGRKDPERCTMLVNQLRVCQDKVLNVIQKIMDEAIEGQRANRDFRVKFPDDVLQDSLAGQLWFGAECLAAGSSILNREVESHSMRPLARALTKNLDSLRGVLRDQCLRTCAEYTERIREALVVFDKLFAEFELSYVSAMVPVKTMKEYDLLQEVTVLFSETVQRALQEALLTQDMIDYCDPALMFTIPRLAIVCGLLIYPEGPLNPDMEPPNMSEMFRPFQTLLLKIRELLYTLSQTELAMLEKALCSSEEPDVSTNPAVGNRSETLLQIDQGFHEGGEGIVPLESIGSNILIHSASSGSPVTPVNIDPEVLDFGQLSPASTLVNELSESEMEDGCLNKSESQDSGLQSEIVSTSETVPPEGPRLVSLDVDGCTHCTDSKGEGAIQSRALLEKEATAVDATVDETNTSERTESSEDTSTQSGSANKCDKTNSSESTDQDSGRICGESCVKSCCRIEDGCEVRHICREIVDEIVINAVHYRDGACDIKTDPTESVAGNAVTDISTEVSDQMEGDGVQSQSEEPSIARQYSWQYNVQFALPQISLGDHDMADRQSAGSFSSDSTISDGTVQHISVSDFVIETLANMNVVSDTPSEQTDQVVSCSSTSSLQRSKYVGDSHSLPSKSHSTPRAPSVSHKLKKRDHKLKLTQATSEHQSTLDKSSTCTHKQKQPKKISVSNISCGVGALPKTVAQNLCDDKTEAQDPADIKTQAHSLGNDITEEQCSSDDKTEGQNSSDGKIKAQSSSDGKTKAQRSSDDKTIAQSSSDDKTIAQSSSDDKTIAQSSSDDKTEAQSSSGDKTEAQSTSDDKTEAQSSSGDKTEALSSSEDKTEVQSSSEDKTEVQSSSEDKTEAQSSSEDNTHFQKSEEDSEVERKAEGNTKAVQTVKTEESTSCSSVQSATSSDCECDTQCTCVESETSSCNSEANDEVEIALAIQAAEIASRHEARSRFRSSSDLIHRLFVCIAGVADQLQTNYASDLRHILKCVFEMNTDSLPELDNEPEQAETSSEAQTQTNDQNNEQQLPSSHTEIQVPPNNETQSSRNSSTGNHHQPSSQGRSRVPSSPRRIFDEPPEWVPDDEVERCTACKTPFTFVRRRHHCRNCGKIFCSKCSSTTVPLPQYGLQKPVRVCHRCFLYQVSHFTVSHDF